MLKASSRSTFVLEPVIIQGIPPPASLHLAYVIFGPILSKGREYTGYFILSYNADSGFLLSLMNPENPGGNALENWHRRFGT